MKIKTHSAAMRFVRGIGLERVAWGLRRLYCPVGYEALVLEVGSGGNPYPRANVLLDAYENTRERHWAPLISDRPTVLGFVENLPFKDKAFDFVIAAHVLEHSSDPARFLEELQRVAKAGYIEVPDAFMERVNPYHDHRLEITCRDGRLLIRKKAKWNADPELIELYEARAKSLIAGELIPRNPFVFHVRYYWQGSINFYVINPDIDAAWIPSESPRQSLIRTASSRRDVLIKFLRNVFSQRRRNSHLDISSLLRCPTCSNPQLLREDAAFKCPACLSDYRVKNGIPILYPIGEGE